MISAEAVNQQHRWSAAGPDDVHREGSGRNPALRSVRWVGKPAVHTRHHACIVHGTVIASSPAIKVEVRESRASILIAKIGAS
jgi:hypothetical protein